MNNYSPVVLMIAAVTYAANAAYCKSKGDISFEGVDFEHAPDWQQDTNCKGVQFRLDHPEATPAAQHQAWLDEKVKQGWVYGAEKNPEAKTHPCIMPYDQLPEDQRKKDALFQAVVDALK